MPWQGGRNVSYIEGWHAIAEANRIFGYDSWDRETLDFRCVAERERKIGRPPNQKDGWGVSYIAKVVVRVGPIVREGCGAGHGIDVDVGQAHESALKEAETDAMKRAMMTFGNPFGLALYDKTQENVADGEKADADFEMMKREIDRINRLDLAAIKPFADHYAKEWAALTEARRALLTDRMAKRRAHLADAPRGDGGTGDDFEEHDTRMGAF